MSLSILLVASGLGAQTAAVFPAPSGPCEVGTTTFLWVDESRDEVLTPEDGDKRELMVQLWYPAAPGGKEELALYLPDFDVFRGVLGPSFWAHEGRLKRARVPARRDAAPLAGPRLPVIVFSTGLGTGRLFYTNQVLELASHGYLVAAIDHTYDAEAVVFPGPRLVTRLDAQGANAEKTMTPDARKKASARLRIWSADQRFVLDQLAKLVEGDGPFKARIDISRVGILGHCYGGEAAMLTAAEDKRFKACVDQNGWPPCQEVQESGLTQPLLFQWGEVTLAVKHLRSQGVDEKALKTLQQTFRNQQRDVLTKLGVPLYFIEIADQEHMDFTDLPMLADWVGRADKDRDAPIELTPRLPIVHEYVVAFFDLHLRNQKSKLLGLPPEKHTKVRFEYHRPGDKARVRRR